MSDQDRASRQPFFEPDSSRWDGGAFRINRASLEEHEEGLVEMLRGNQGNPIFRAIMDILDLRIVTIKREMLSLPNSDTAGVMAMHGLHRAYEDIAARIEEHATRAERIAAAERRETLEKKLNEVPDELLGAGLQQGISQFWDQEMPGT